MVEIQATCFHPKIIVVMFALRFQNKTQRGVRVVEGARLESVYAGNCIESSNLFPSANYLKALTKVNAFFAVILTE